MSYIHPVGDYPITDDYAAHIKRGSAEPGVDWATPTGTPAYAIADGIVTRAAFSPTRGYVIDVHFNDGSRGAYLHMSRLDVSAGARVKRGQRVGLTGNTGASRGPHLHFTYWSPGNRGGYLATDDFMLYYNASAAGGGGKDEGMSAEGEKQILNKVNSIGAIIGSSYKADATLSDKVDDILRIVQDNRKELGGTVYDNKDVQSLLGTLISKIERLEEKLG